MNAVSHPEAVLFRAESDEQLVARAKDGDDEALTALIQRYAPFVRMRAGAYGVKELDADDLYQEGMIALYKAIRTYDESYKSSFASYATLCIEHELYNVIKGANRQKNIPLNTYVSLYSPLNTNEDTNSREILADTLQPAELTNPEDIIIDQENVTDIESTIKKRLSKLEQQVVTLYIDGNNYQQIATALGKTPKSIDNALQRIKKKLS